MKLNPQPMDPAQQQIFAIMPWLMVFIMAPFAAGLQLYWMTNNVLTIAQQWWLYRKFGLHLSRHAPGPHMSVRGGRRSSPSGRASCSPGRSTFLKSAPELQVPARSRRAGDRVRRPLQRRQELAAQRADQPQGAGAHLEHAGPDAGAQLLRRRRAAADPAGRHARLRLCRGAEGHGQALALPGERLSARPRGAEARAGAGRFAPRPQGRRPRGDATCSTMPRSAITSS